MILTLPSGKEVKIGVKHTEDETIPEYGDQLFLGTRVRLSVKDKFDIEARSVCKPPDQFKKSEGRKYAASRLLGVLGENFSMADKKAIFTCICSEYRSEERRRRLVFDFFHAVRTKKKGEKRVSLIPDDLKVAILNAVCPAYVKRMAEQKVLAAAKKNTPKYLEQVAKKKAKLEAKRNSPEFIKRMEEQKTKLEAKRKKKELSRKLEEKKKLAKTEYMVQGG
jgi:hypothetical protein